MGDCSKDSVPSMLALRHGWFLGLSTGRDHVKQNKEAAF